VLLSVALSPGSLSAEWLAHQTRWLNAGADWPEKDFRLCTVDLDSGERVVFSAAGTPGAGAGEAVAASCAIPGVFAPVPIGDRLYIDGGAWSPTNADVLAGMGLDTVIIVAPMSLEATASIDGRDRSVRTACRAIALGEAAQLRREGTDVAIIEPIANDVRVMGRLAGIDPLDERRCPAVVRQVRESTAARILAGAIPGLEVLGSRASVSLAA
jgi:NTE family protein